MTDTTMNTGAASLLPCPFCGGAAYIEQPGTRRQSCIVECDSCGLRHESGDEGAMCGTSWNRRTTPQADAAPSGDAIATELWKAADACGFEQFRETVSAAIAAGGAQERQPYGWAGAGNYWRADELTAKQVSVRTGIAMVPIYAAPLPRAAATVPQIKPRLLTQLRRFNECCEDCDAGGHDVDKEDMHSLAELGAVRPAPGGRHYMTDFGHYLLAAASNGEQS